MYREGRVYVKENQAVYDHDFPSFATGIAIPHGIYDEKRNQAYLTIGASKDTSEFVCDSVLVMHYAGLGGESDRSMTVVKMRRTDDIKGPTPVKLSNTGVEVISEKYDL